MKKIFYLMLLAIMPVFFISCSNEDDGINQLVGTWQYSDEHYSFKITIGADGNGSWEEMEYGSSTKIISGKISIKEEDGKIWIAILKENNVEDGLFYVVIKGNKMYLYEDDIPDEPEEILTKINDAGDDEIKTKLIGTWKNMYDDGSHVHLLLVFQANGTMYRHVIDDEGNIIENQTETFRYRIIDQHLYADDLDHGVYKDEWDDKGAISISNNILTLVSDRRGTKRYKKIR